MRTATACILVLVLAVVAGVWLRLQVWEWTMPIRFVGDINNGFNWGKVANKEGYLNLYETLGEPAPDKRRIDYAPLRLGIMTAWVKWLADNNLPLRARQSDWHYHAPLLNFNMTLELLTAIGAFLLTWIVHRRSLPARPQYTWPLATGAFLLAWFCPPTLYESHAWPQWDIWPMPFFLMALCFGLLRKWLVAGLLVGLASMLKGQILMVAWILPLWALGLGDWRGAVRILVGVVTSILIVGSPWALSRYDPATQTRSLVVVGIALTVLLALIAALLPRRFSLSLFCVAISTSLAISMLYLGGTKYWLQSSFEVGTWNYRTMYMGPTSNLPALLATRFGWNKVDEPIFTLPAIVMRDRAGGEWFAIGGVVTIRTLMLVIFALLSAACGLAAAWLDRRRDRRVVLALTLPWMIFFLIPLQIHERYLVFVSVCAATWIICGPGVLLLGMLVSLVAFIHLVHQNLSAARIPRATFAEIGQRPWGFVRSLIEGTHPGIAWLLILAMLALLYCLFRPIARPISVEKGVHD